MSVSAVNMLLRKWSMTVVDRDSSVSKDELDIT